MSTPDYESTYSIQCNAKAYGMMINNDSVHVNKIISNLDANETKYGAPYCPCLNNHNEHTICPCRYMRENKACRCGLYVRKQEESK